MRKTCKETCRNYPANRHAPNCINNKVNWIIHTSIDDARQTIRSCCDTNVLTEALGKELSARKPRTTLINTLESRIRQVERKAAQCGVV
jgi:hypothetical protein